jgi:phosphoribosyl 1,2-cyclic phosphodiesterase
MQITFWGTRGSIPVPGVETLKYGGNTCCLELGLENGMRVVVDAGTGIRPLGEKLAREDKVSNILLLITHIHWDHLQGFPFFLPAYIPSFHIMVDGFRTCMKGLTFIFRNKMIDGVFPITLEELKANISYLGNLEEKKEAQYDSLRVNAIELHHPQGGYGFKFQEENKILTFITDNELSEHSWKGRELRNYVDFVKGSELLIHDAQYTQKEYSSRRNWGHSTFDMAFELAKRSEVPRLIFFHHDPTRTDKMMDEILTIFQEKASSIGLQVDAAREGETLTI